MKQLEFESLYGDFWTEFELTLDQLDNDSTENIHDFPCLLYTSPSPRDLSTSRMPSSA